MKKKMLIVIGLAGVLAGGSACSSSQPKSQAMTDAEQNQAKNQPSQQPGQKAKAQAGQTSSQAQASSQQKAKGQPGQLGVQNVQAGSEAQAGGQQLLGIVKAKPGTAQITTEQKVAQTHSIPTVTETKIGADINRMNVADFKALGLTGEQAKDVVKYRQMHGPFTSIQQLSKVPGLDSSWIADNADRLAVGNTIG